ncbi:hypothetical protein TraAM80_04052 [Trypanosoma rangeli]|uniref:Uncharacterized protein n=1 Tax=Trypanosoma rangeli TaxID=5698 RepID=A0A422NLJ9_TRYRA|nr:uncharacterized protein TraAM80_04052 [Trypanosoma rangeli]RNF06229.1 hypothetical protein TraAM80_04052 [Trypanosoma rangeli]|eukprot:RNF06229.1 hypothetical protein TraAM80_04052 [Trypanosoma rangeli]
MSSARLTEVESKINEVRHRLANLSLSFQHDEDTECPPAVFAIKEAGRRTSPLVERDVNKNVTVKSEVPAPTGDMNRLVELAKREAAQRESCHPTPQRLGCKVSKTASFLSKERTQGAPHGHAYYDSTPADQTTQYCGAAVTSVASFQQPSARPVRRAPLYSSDSPQSASSCFGRCFDVRAAAAPMTQLTPERGSGFDPLQAVQARLREKLRKSVVSRSLHSSEESTARSPSPSLKPQEQWQKTQPRVSVCVPDDAVSDTVQTELGGCGEQAHEGPKRPTVEATTPNVRAATKAVRRVKQQFASPASPGAASLSHSLNGEGHRQKHVAPKPVMREVFARFSSVVHSEGSANRSSQRQPLQTPRRSSVVGSRQESPCRVAQPALPLKTTPQRTVLDVLTGAEVFALMRLRGIIVSRGETGESALPEARCHSIYLSHDEHKQLLELRANLQLRSSSAMKLNGKRQSRAQRSASTRSSSRSLPLRQSSSAGRAATKQ